MVQVHKDSVLTLFSGFFSDGVITSAYTLGVTVRSVALRRDQLSPSHWPVVAVA